MKLRSLRLTVIGFVIMLIVASRAPRATPPPVDVVATIALQLAYEMFTMSAAAASPTPLPATVTPTLSPTEIPALEPTRSGPIPKPKITEFTGCYYGPGPEFGLDSNIELNQRVDIVGIGSVAGWYVIINPYFHKQCWVEAKYLEIDPANDLSALPMMTPVP